MKNRFILVINDTTKEQQDTITCFFKDAGQGYWHWFSDLWLLTDSSDTWTLITIREKVRELIPSGSFLVFSVENGKEIAGYCPREMIEWITKDWKG